MPPRYDGNPQFGTEALEAVRGPDGETVAMTALLAGIVEAARPTVAFLDDAHLLPEATAQTLLPYLLHNLPPNMQLVIGTRQALGLPLSEFAARGEYAEIGVEALRLRVDESIGFLRARFGGRFDADACARINQCADGWPIALLLVTSVLEHDPTLDFSVIAGKSPNIEHFFTETLLARLPPADADLLVSASILDALHPELVRAMTGSDDAAALLDRLAATTPILAMGEGSAWLRMHPLARQALGGLFRAPAGAAARVALARGRVAARARRRRGGGTPCIGRRATGRRLRMDRPPAS